MRCQACHRKVSSPQWVGRYAYGPVCFTKMFPAPKRAKREKVAVVIDDHTGDLFAPWYEPCHFYTMGAQHAQQLGVSA